MTQPRQTSTASAVLLGLLAAFAVGAAIGAALLIRPSAAATQGASAPHLIPPSAPPPSFAPVAYAMPEVVDLDGDGGGDLVGLFVDARDGTLRAAAIDGKTWTPRWTVGPIAQPMRPLSPQALVVGDRLVVSDGQGTVRVLAVASGKEIMSRGFQKSGAVCHATDAGAEKTTPTKAKPTEVLIESARGDGNGGTFFDVVSGTRTAKTNVSCHPRLLCTRPDQDDCYDVKRPNIADREPRLDVFAVFRDGDSRVAYGNERDGWGAGYTKGTRKYAWKSSLAIDADPPASEMRHAIDAGVFVSAYETGDGRGRIMARNAQSGEPMWNAQIEGPEAYPVDLVATRGRVMLLTRGGVLHVLDEKTGRLAARIGDIAKAPAPSTSGAPAPSSSAAPPPPAAAAR